MLNVSYLGIFISYADASRRAAILTTTAAALYVVLTTQAAGRFSDNVLLLEAGAPRSLSFLAWGALDYDLLKSSVRVEHLAENVARGPLEP